MKGIPKPNIFELFWFFLTLIIGSIPLITRGLISLSCLNCNGISIKEVIYCAIALNLSNITLPRFIEKQERTIILGVSLVLVFILGIILVPILFTEMLPHFFINLQYYKIMALILIIISIIIFYYTNKYKAAAFITESIKK